MDSTNLRIDPKLIDVVINQNSGYPEEYAREDTIENLAMLGARDFPSELWIEPKDWKEVARENDKYGTWAESRRARFTNQSPTHECTCHALIQVYEAAYNKARSGIGRPVFISQISVYAEANSRQWGGSSCQRVIGIMANRGALPEPINGQDELFKHTLHGTCGKGNENNSSGRWVPVDRFPQGWQQTARHFAPDEIINPKSIEECICLLLHGFAVGVGRNGHSVPWNQVAWDNPSDDPWKGLYIPYSDSYDVIRYDSLRTARGAVGGSYSIRLNKIPGDWFNPAGPDGLKV